MTVKAVDTKASVTITVNVLCSRYRARSDTQSIAFIFIKLYGVLVVITTMSINLLKDAGNFSKVYT